jgi:hypothetical protein
MLLIIISLINYLVLSWWFKIVALGYVSHCIFVSFPLKSVTFAVEICKIVRGGQNASTSQPADTFLAKIHILMTYPWPLSTAGQQFYFFRQVSIHWFGIALLVFKWTVHCHSFRVSSSDFPLPLSAANRFLGEIQPARHSLSISWQQLSLYPVLFITHSTTDEDR